MASPIGLKQGGRKMPKVNTGQATGKSKVISSGPLKSPVKAGGVKSTGNGGVKAAKAR